MLEGFARGWDGAVRARAMRIGVPVRRLAQAATRIAARLFSEPLAHFVVAGLVLFIAGRAYESATSTYRIVVTPRHVAQLANDYALQFGGQPDPKTLDALVQRDVHDEMLLREGMALKL